MGPGLRRDPISWFLSFGAAAAGARRYREADKLARAVAVQEQQDIAVGGSLLQLVGRFLRRLHWLLVDRDDDIARLDPERGGRAVACDLGHDDALDILRNAELAPQALIDRRKLQTEACRARGRPLLRRTRLGVGGLLLLRHLGCRRGEVHVLAAAPDA